MRTVSLQLPDTVFAALGKDPDEFVGSVLYLLVCFWKPLPYLNLDTITKDLRHDPVE